MKQTLYKWFYIGFIIILSLFILIWGFNWENKMFLVHQGYSTIRIYNPQGKMIFKSEAKATIQRNRDVLQYMDRKGIYHSVDYGTQDLVTVDSNQK